MASPTGRPVSRSASATRCGVSVARRAGEPVADRSTSGRARLGRRRGHRSEPPPRRPASSTPRAARPRALRRERTGPRPRSIASARPRWSGIDASSGAPVARATRARSTPRPRRTTRAVVAVGEPGADAHRGGDPGDGGHDHRPAAGRSARPPRRRAGRRCAAGRRRRGRGRGAPPTAPPGPRTPAECPAGPAYQVSAPSPSRRGSASRSDRALSRPVVWHSASQRTPSSPSSPSTRSRPGPSGSASITTAPAGAGGRPARGRRRSVVAPAPPEPPITPTTSPRRAALAEVGEGLDQPAPRSAGARRHSPRPAPARPGTARRRTAPHAHDVDAVAARRARDRPSPRPGRRPSSTSGAAAQPRRAAPTSVATRA